jgi:hypothetical protein
MLLLAASSNQMRNAVQDINVLNTSTRFASCQNALDLDQAELEKQLARGTDGSFATAKIIHTDGANCRTPRGRGGGKQ